MLDSEHAPGVGEEWRLEAAEEAPIQQTALNE